MIKLDPYIACPICHSSVQAQSAAATCAVSCEVCGRTYQRSGNFYNMIPEPPPEVLAQKWHLWEELQNNAVVSYEMAPELNLATEGEDFRSFGDFMQLAGLVLDIGCGPRDLLPAYAISPHEFTYIGLDPLAGEQPRGYPFVQGLAEFLPFKDDLFDHVVFGSAIDHLLDYHLGLHETARILKPGGSIHILADVLPAESIAQSKIFRLYDIGRRGLMQIVRSLRSMGVGRTMRYVKSMAGLKIPEGAMDFFHVYFPQAEEIQGALESAHLVDVRKEQHDDWIFISARKSL